MAATAGAERAAAGTRPRAWSAPPSLKPPPPTPRPRVGVGLGAQPAASRLSGRRHGGSYLSASRAVLFVCFFPCVRLNRQLIIDGHHRTLAYHSEFPWVSVKGLLRISLM